VRLAHLEKPIEAAAWLNKTQRFGLEDSDLALKALQPSDSQLLLEAAPREENLKERESSEGKEIRWRSVEESRCRFSLFEIRCCCSSQGFILKL
jgi:hypothetical protein